MYEDNELLWTAKLAARLHDPVEKALILMRTREGHEHGTSQQLRAILGLTDLSATVRSAVKQADHWASAADRAAFPNRNADGRYPAWQNVRFDQKPVIIHPLTGREFAIDKLSDVEPAAVKALALDHCKRLIHAGNLRRTALAFWRFGPEIDAPALKSLWAQLPADTRVPDHTIHDHLDLTAALAGAFTLDAENSPTRRGPALLAVSLGPVQAFIAAARSSSDLWAGSHLLSRLAWEAMRVICDALGPEAILFPRLRGIPQVDLWLREDCGLHGELFADCAWKSQRSDANPLFAAALPNRFTALVPAGQARALAERITEKVRGFAREQTEDAYRLLLQTAGIADNPALPGYAQIREQLADFPEVHWAAVPWSLVGSDADGRVEAGDSRLAEAMQPFFASRPPGYLGSPAWGLLSRGITLEDGWFWQPNPGTLYPALHELLERLLAAGKAVRPFAQTTQYGWRDALNGETEWLTHDRNHLALPPGRRTDTLWAKVAAERQSWAKKGEHLGALNTLKRLWPNLLVNELKTVIEVDVNRFVVSTHTMALATSLARAIGDKRTLPEALRRAIHAANAERVALPRRLDRLLREHPDGDTLRRLPGWLEAQRDTERERDERRAEGLLREFLGHAPEAYYGLILMDGDRMGAWLSADRNDPDIALAHRASFHPQIRAGLERFVGDPNFAAYAEELRSPSPSRHMAIAEALNHFALRLAPLVVEQQHHGRIVYAGGDDLMAMLPVLDLLPAMAGLRAVYAGIDPADVGGADLDIGLQRQGNGFAVHSGQLLRLMGDKATASCGVVVAHHQAPLAAVLRELRAAEQRAKHDGGRDAFSLSIVKRSGGALRLTAKWGEPLRLLVKLREFLAEPAVSRRAVYNSALWLQDLPEPDGAGEMVVAMLTYQLRRQTAPKARKTISDYYDLPGLARSLVAETIRHADAGKRLDWLVNCLSVAEFLARETRIPEAAQAHKENAA